MYLNKHLEQELPVITSLQEKTIFVTLDCLTYDSTIDDDFQSPIFFTVLCTIGRNCYRRSPEAVTFVPASDNSQFFLVSYTTY